MMPMVAALGAPVMDAGGNRAAKISAKGRLVCAATLEVICQTVACFSTANNSQGLTLPGQATRPRSLRTMSVIITFSARSLALRTNSSAKRRSSAKVIPRGRVPFIGLERIA